MSSDAARAHLLAIALAILGAAACDAASVDLGSDLHPHLPPAVDDAGGGGAADDAGAPGTGGSSGAVDGSGGMPSPPVTPRDGGIRGGEDAAIGIDADIDAGRGGEDAGECDAPLADCDEDDDNGCEVDLDTDVEHCGSCDRACPAFGFMSFGSTCVAGKCVLTCEAPHADCDEEPDNGCEADLRFGTGADSNCGACGVVCDCNNGTCN